MTRKQFDSCVTGTKLVWRPTGDKGRLRILTRHLRLIIWEDGDTTVLREFKGEVIASDGVRITSDWYEGIQLEREAAR